jgi:hypothetical protein
MDHSDPMPSTTTTSSYAIAVTNLKPILPHPIPQQHHYHPFVIPLAGICCLLPRSATHQSCCQGAAAIGAATAAGYK